MTPSKSSRRVLFLALTALSAACSGSDAPTGATSREDAAPAGAHGAPVPGDEVRWTPAPRPFPEGAELAVIQGDPTRTGQVFTVRLRMPNDYLFPPHFHPEDEHVTVLQGTFEVGMGSTVGIPAVTLRTGGFITAPAGVRHWARARGRTIVQVHGIGPFQTIYVQEDGTPIPGGGQ